MQKHQIVKYGSYQARVSGRDATVIIESDYMPRRGWRATNERTNRTVWIKSAQRLRGPINNTAREYAAKHPAKVYKRKARPAPSRSDFAPDGWLELDGPNRVCDAIRATRDDIDKRKPNPKLVELHRKQLDLGFPEFVRFQELKSLAFIRKRLTFDEAQTVYNLLGETPDVFNSRDFATKLVLTRLFIKLLSEAIRERQAG